MRDPARRTFGAADELSTGDYGSEFGSHSLQWYRELLLRQAGNDSRMVDELRLASDATGINPMENSALEPILDRNARILQMLIEGMDIPLNQAIEYALDLMRKETVTIMIGM